MPEEGGEAIPDLQAEAGVGEVDGTLYEGLGQSEQPDAAVEESEQLVTVKIDGVESQVPLSEATAGYQRQADYTAKTQALASERQQLEQAEKFWNSFEKDPERTLAALNAAYGFGATESNADEDTEPVDPFRVEVEQFMAQQREQAIAQQIEGALTKLHTQHGEFDDKVLIDYAVANNIPNLDVAFAAFAYTSPDAVKARADAGVNEAKGNLPPVAGGHSVQGGSVTEGTGPAQTVREAFEMAARSHGRTDLI